MMPDDAINQIGKFIDGVNKATRGIALIQVGMTAQFEALTLPYRRIQAVVESCSISTKVLTEALRNIYGVSSERVTKDCIYLLFNHILFN